MLLRGEVKADVLQASLYGGGIKTKTEIKRRGMRGDADEAILQEGVRGNACGG